MAGDVIQFPGAKSWNLKKIEEIINAKLTHENPDVLNELKAELKTVISKYYEEKDFEVRLQLPSGLTESQIQELEENFQNVFTEHHGALIKKAQAIFLDLCLAKLEVCELRASLRAEDKS